MPVAFQIDEKEDELYPWDLNNILDIMRVPRGEKGIRKLKKWKREELRAHLGTFTKEELRPPAWMRGGAGQS